MANKRNVLIVSVSSDKGGMETHILNILEGLHNRFNFFVVCPRGDLFEDYKKYSTVFSFYPKLDISPLYILRLIFLVKEYKIDVIHAHELKAVVNALIAGKLSRVPLIISHQHTPISMWQVGSIRRSLDAFVYRMFVNLLSSVEIALSEVIKDQKIREGIVGSKIVVIPNGIDLDLYKVRKDIKEKFRNEMCDKYKIPKGCKILGCITRLTVEKGHTVLVNAARALMSESTNVRLRYIIVGDGVLRDKLKRLVKSSGLDALFIFTGQVSEEEKVKLLATFDLFVFPTLAEGFGISALEAMASGVPCIVSGLPILREVCGNSVEYFETGNPNDLKSVLKRSLEGGYRVPEADIKLQASKYDIKLFWEKYNSLYLI